jgi:hypothetical protein
MVDSKNSRQLPNTVRKLRVLILDPPKGCDIRAARLAGRVFIRDPGFFAPSYKKIRATKKGDGNPANGPV